MEDSLRVGARDYGLRWQAQRDTALTRVSKGWPVAKAPSSLRSAGALQCDRLSSMPRIPEYASDSRELYGPSSFLMTSLRPPSTGSISMRPAWRAGAGALSSPGGG